MVSPYQKQLVIGYQWLLVRWLFLEVKYSALQQQILQNSTHKHINHHQNIFNATLILIITYTSFRSFDGNAKLYVIKVCLYWVHCLYDGQIGITNFDVTFACIRDIKNLAWYQRSHNNFSGSEYSGRHAPYPEHTKITVPSALSAGSQCYRVIHLPAVCTARGSRVLATRQYCDCISTTTGSTRAAGGLRSVRGVSESVESFSVGS